MAVGLYCFPVGIKYEQQSGSGAAYSCSVACDAGRCYATQTNVHHYENGTNTIVSTTTGAILPLDDPEGCPEVEVDNDWDPEFDYGVYESSEPVAYGDEISADAVIAAAVGALVWGSVSEAEVWHGTMAAWVGSGLAVSAVTSAEGDGGSASCGQTRFRLTRLPGMPAIGVTARWQVKETATGDVVGEGSAPLNAAAATSGWIEVGNGQFIDQVTFDIGPYTS